MPSPRTSSSVVGCGSSMGSSSMYARIARAKFLPEQSDEVVEVAGQCLAVFQQQPGFQQMTYYYDRASGWGIAAGHWDTVAHADAATAAAQRTLDRFIPLFDEPARSAAGSFDFSGPLPLFEIIAQA